MPKRNLYLFSLFSGLLLALAWPTFGFAPILFVAFVPLLLVEYEIATNSSKYKKIQFIGFAYLSFFVWNLATTWWICFASFGGAALAIIVNSLLMTSVFVAYHNLKKRIGQHFEGVIFIFLWILFEFLHHRWDLSWPWLTLGNAFSTYIKWIQWYEYTGYLGGSLWVLVVNVLVFKVIKNRLYQLNEIKYSKSIKYIVLALFLPIAISYVIYYTYHPSEKEVEVVVVQPNIDPYNDKFSKSYQEQIVDMLVLASERVDTSTDYLVFPETAITENIEQNNYEKSFSINAIRQFLRHYPKLKIVIGASVIKYYKPNEKLSSTARMTNNNTYIDFYNSALQIALNENVQLYHKSCLVPGVEKMPFPALLKPLEKLAINMGGTSGSLGTQDYRAVFNSSNLTTTVAPIICYESVFGDFVTDYVKKGANLIFIITNDGWWQDTPGYKQHLAYASLRAIENRRSIARSANTGISCFINEKGESSQLTEWWKTAIIKKKISVNDKLTFYSNYGDIILLIPLLITILFTFLLKLFTAKV